MRTKILHTERLQLRPMALGDADAITCWVSDVRVAEMTSLIPHPYEKADAESWLAAMESERGRARHEPFAIVLRESGELIGCIGFQNGEDEREAVFGYWLGVPHWGRGYMTEALRELLRHGFEDLLVERISAHHFVHNPASGRVMEKAGLRFEGMTALGAERGGERFDRRDYGLSNVEWCARKREIGRTALSSSGET